MTPDDIKARIAARRAEAVERRAIAEAATPGPWECGVHAMDECRIDATGPESMTIYDEGGHGPEDAAHITANDPATVIRDQDRIIAGCDADLALLDWLDGFTPGFGHMPAISNSSHATRGQVYKALAARYADTDGDTA